MINNIDDQLEEYRDARRNAFVTALTINSTGKLIAGIFGVNIPREILWSLDIVPINIYSIDGSNIAAAEELIDTENCSLIKASYGYAITGKCPLTHFANILVSNDICPNKISMIKKLGNLKKLYILPEISAIDTLALEYRKFVFYLEQEFNIRINETKLAYAIRKTNDINKKMNELLNMCMLKPNIICCDDLYSIIYGSQFIFDLDVRYEKLLAITESIKGINNDMILSDNVKLKRILISGVPQAGLKEKILKPLSEINNVVAMFSPSFCEGESYNLTDETVDPYTALAEKYLYTQPFQNLEFINNSKVDAIINVRFAGCHTLSDRYEYTEKPHLCITTDYSDNDKEEILHQLNAFIYNL